MYISVLKGRDVGIIFPTMNVLSNTIKKFTLKFSFFTAEKIVVHCRGIYFELTYSSKDFCCNFDS